MDNEKNKNSSKLQNLNLLIWLAIVLLLTALFLYFTHFSGNLSDDTSKWGTFGDFMGGTLNPMFALLSLFAIIYTIRIQTEELELTRDEMKKSNKSQEEQSQSLKIQNRSIEQQTFENTFFKMIDLHNQIVNNLLLIQIMKNEPRHLPGYKTFKTPQNYHIGKVEINLEDDRDYKGREVIARLLNILKGSKRKNFGYPYYEAFHKEFQNIIGHYFGTIYQILKFIDNSNIENKEQYANLFRSQFSAAELELLFYHGTSEIAKNKFIPLLIKYEFFEHLPNAPHIDVNIIRVYVERTKEIDPSYENSKIFGKNISWNNDDRLTNYSETLSKNSKDQ